MHTWQHARPSKIQRCTLAYTVTEHVQGWYPLRRRAWGKQPVRCISPKPTGVSACTKVDEVATNAAATNGDSVAERGWTSARAGSGVVWMDGRLGWRTVLLLDERGVMNCRVWATSRGSPDVISAGERLVVYSTEPPPGASAPDVQGSEQHVWKLRPGEKPCSCKEGCYLQWSGIGGCGCANNGGACSFHCGCGCRWVACSSTPPKTDVICF